MKKTATKRKAAKTSSIASNGNVEIMCPLRLSMSKGMAALLLRNLKEDLPRLKHDRFRRPHLVHDFVYGEALIIDGPMARRLIPLLEKVVEP